MSGAVDPVCIDGLYPHLTMFNDEGECGVGAVVPWAGDLWVTTYAPHRPVGSTDKLYRIHPDLTREIFPESVGGTSANRLIHRETKQLLIGSYVIDSTGHVRVVPPVRMPGRLTGAARHLEHPAEKVYVATMETGLYELDMRDLSVRTLIRENGKNDLWIAQYVSEHGGVWPDNWSNAPQTRVPGYHAKGLSSGFGRVFVANNGEDSDFARSNVFAPSGVLADWQRFGEDWRTIRRCQFTELTTRDGIYGNEHPQENPVWSLGWDAKSVILAVTTNGTAWSYYRLPKASHAYDGAHGWNTEWPRIRDIGEPWLLATMHGTFWRFPQDFSPASPNGIRPISTYLKVIGDFCRWGDRLVFGCDDQTQKEFTNVRTLKRGAVPRRQSQSNLWFVKPEELGSFGPPSGEGWVWRDEDVRRGDVSDPYLWEGYAVRMFTFVDAEGRAVRHELLRDGDWVRVRALEDATGASAYFRYGPERPESLPNALEKPIAVRDDDGTVYRFPNLNGDENFICREVATDRDLLYAGGVFYEVPAVNAGGFAELRPIALADEPVTSIEASQGILRINGKPRALDSLWQNGTASQAYWLWESVRKTDCAPISAARALGMGIADAGGFSHEMPSKTHEKPLDTPYAEMADVFKNPCGKVQTGCYWYWMAGNVSCEGVKKDIEAMKRAGIDRLYVGDIGSGDCEQGPVKTFSPEWNDALQTAFSAASRLGMEIGLFNSPGWSQSGGPWVKPELAMRRIVASSILVDGPKDGVVLPQPKFELAPEGDMRDVCAIAYPLPKGFTNRLERRGGENTPFAVEMKNPLAVELESDKPFTAQSAEVAFKGGKVSGTIAVEADLSGAWRKVCEMPFSRVRHTPGVGFAPHAPVLVSFAPISARKFRVTVKPDGDDRAEFSSVAVCGAPLVERAFEKSLAKMYESALPMWSEYQWPDEPECSAETALDPSKAVVLTGRVAPDGRLDWNVPDGRWVIYRIGAAPTGTKNGPANPEATGYEVDKMSREHIAAHFDAYLGRILEATPPESRKSIRHAVIDSYEQGGQNFTDGFAEKFKASFGYDPTPYLPAMHGMAVGSRTKSDRFLWDLRRFVADEVAYAYVGGLRKASNAHGMETWLECYGHWGFPGEFLQYGGQSDGIAGEYWCEGSTGDIENRAASSCAHIYGRRLVWSESNTSARRWFERGLMDLKQRTDRFFAEGVNASILHVYIHQADERKPGRIAWFGNEFNRHNTWFEHFDLYTGYLKRCGWMLRQGLNVADVVYFIGEDAPKMTGVCEPALPAGRQFDYINAEVLAETASVDGRGRVVLPHGTAYEVLVLPKLETMRPRMAECVERLVSAGAFVLGPKPLRSPSLAGQPQSDTKVKEIADRLWGDSSRPGFVRRGKGVVAWGLSLEEALKMRGSEPDVAFDAKCQLAYAHRTMPNAEIYFITNQSGEEIPAVDVSFRVAGRVPELWIAATGERRVAEKWREENGRTAVALSLAKHESVFVVFPKNLTQRLQSAQSCSEETSHEIGMPGSWTATFESDELHRGPKESVILDRLIDLSTADDPAIKFYSGKIVYRTKFHAEQRRCGVAPHAVLDLGEVAITAKVKMNGQSVGGVCFAPYRLDVSPFVKDGENELEIEVCNRWVNRLVGDDGMENRPTWTSLPCCDKAMKLPKSGLLGPVAIRFSSDFCVATLDSCPVACAETKQQANTERQIP